MANTFLTPNVIAREALATLYANTVFLPLVWRDFSNDFAAKVGDTVTIKKPPTFTAQEFTGTTTAQDATETSTTVKLDHHLDVTIDVTTAEMTLELEDFRNTILQPAMEAHAQKVDTLIASLYKDVYNTVGTAGTTPDAVSDITAVRRVLNENLAPLGNRYLVIDPAAEEKFLNIGGFTWANQVGDDGTALSEARLDRKFGLDVIMSQNISAHDRGTISTSALAVNGATTAGATTINLDAAAVTGTLNQGTLFTIAGDDTVYVVTANKTASTNAYNNVPIAPALAVDAADNAVVTVMANDTPNLGFHQTAFSFVTRPLAMPMGGVQAEVINYKGVGLRVVYGYNMSTKTNTVSIDMLCGVKTLRPELAVRLLG